MFHQLASERDTPNAVLETIPEEQTPHVSAMEHPKDKSLQNFLFKTDKAPQEEGITCTCRQAPTRPF